MNMKIFLLIFFLTIPSASSQRKSALETATEFENRLRDLSTGEDALHMLAMYFTPDFIFTNNHGRNYTSFQYTSGPRALMLQLIHSSPGIIICSLGADL
ncbi:unnamed protein product [Caenorhabditis angaria]|uniref:DUF4440 domain-containing protein n=1 Tax=Caenorhabditis angaria TaxID=860376 RepID=A0A9P1N0S9_9PELO|nr:unnamed protein product [Caenorhabditis angaria]